MHATTRPAANACAGDRSHDDGALDAGPIRLLLDGSVLDAELPQRVDPATAISVFFLVQNSLNDIVRHARMRQVVVDINGGAPARNCNWNRSYATTASASTRRGATLPLHSLETRHASHTGR
ncbi:hypothetical protein [Massilia sp. 9096]|uniref:hypothetical protein n=1 Tax=Massilia sp. 9096 TaxID=1500894 RepID=UPI00055A66F6|nr:hypothetical protein [Massilia sp. 9096]